MGGGRFVLWALPPSVGRPALVGGVVLADSRGVKTVLPRFLWKDADLQVRRDGTSTEGRQLEETLTCAQRSRDASKTIPKGGAFLRGDGEAARSCG